MNDLYVCPLCHAPLQALHCVACNREFRTQHEIPDFSTRDHYWNQLSPEQMEVLLEISEAYGYRYGIEKIAGLFKDPYLIQYALDPYRADFRAILPITPETHVLDLGSGWGAVACALAPSCCTITVADTNPYNLRFIRMRARQSGVNNLRAVRIDPLDDARLPFPDNTFGVVLLNGVLEYVGSASQDVSAEEAQRRCLREIRRVLRPDGVLYVGIENRYSYRYFMGVRDHSSLRYTSILPRPIASLMTRLRQGRPYRTYTYSHQGYRSLLASAGFTPPEIYIAYPSYREPRFILPGDNDQAIVYFVRRHLSYIRRKRLRHLIEAMINYLPLHLSGRAIRQICDSYLLVAGAGK
ncbi:MAG: class I SAM-dependent methyltransferase [Chloroherpetonaceae bacterium]|nr:class I SAM-dependent methyltransferase [Chthonomonadaceae bacterium]MDW8208466.1 class I SAM-dependent methyltransferase [Chloroherpetonaceae bacterium]